MKPAKFTVRVDSPHADEPRIIVRRDHDGAELDFSYIRSVDEYFVKAFLASIRAKKVTVLP